MAPLQSQSCASLLYSGVQPKAMKKDQCHQKEIRQEKSQQMLAFVHGWVWVSNRAWTALFDAKTAKALVKAGNLTT